MHHLDDEFVPLTIPIPLDIDMPSVKEEEARDEGKNEMSTILMILILRFWESQRKGKEKNKVLKSTPGPVEKKSKSKSSVPASIQARKA